MRFLALLMTVALAGCSAVAWNAGAEKSIPSTATRAYFDSAEPSMAHELASGFAGPVETAVLTPATPPAETRRLMVYSAQVAVSVARPEEAFEALEAETERLGGYLLSRRGSTIVVRVPAAQFRSFVEFVKARGRVVDESMQAVDVTDQYRDLTIRLDNAKKARERLISLLDRAEKVEDILEIEKELTRLTTEIESMTAQRKALDERIAFSEISISVGGVRPRTQQARRFSEFGWINAIGVEEVMQW
ncbi:MAG: DUF4349 domain-containing protein [Planctomycetes bacterium]|nr:DUF4349 domain-containing protein [Planctomycetota bacterium]